MFTHRSSGLGVRFAGCVEALSKDRALLLAFWTVHRPPSSAALALALRLLHALAAAPPAAWCAAAQGGAVYLLTALLPVTPPPAHEAVRPCLRSLDPKIMAHRMRSPRIHLTLCKQAWILHMLCVRSGVSPPERVQVHLATHMMSLRLCSCLQEAAETVRAAVATLLSQLSKQPLHGPRTVLLLNRLLPPGLVAAIEVPAPRLSAHPMEFLMLFRGTRLCGGILIKARRAAKALM